MSLKYSDIYTEQMTETLTPRVRKGGLKSQKGQVPELKVPFLFNGVTCSWSLFLCPWSFGGDILRTFTLPCFIREAVKSPKASNPSTSWLPDDFCPLPCPSKIVSEATQCNREDLQEGASETGGSRVTSWFSCFPSGSGGNVCLPVGLNVHLCFNPLFIL